MLSHVYVGTVEKCVTLNLKGKSIRVVRSPYVFFECQDFDLLTETEGFPFPLGFTSTGQDGEPVSVP